MTPAAAAGTEAALWVHAVSFVVSAAAIGGALPGARSATFAVAVRAGPGMAEEGASANSATG